MKSKTLPTIRVSEESIQNMKSAVDKYNKSTIGKLSIQDFRRLSYEMLSQIILQDKIKEIPVKFE